MTWMDFTSNWAASAAQLKSRFPLFDEKMIPDDPGAEIVAAHLAHQHDLTQAEAEEEIQDWLFVQALARRATELEAS